MNKKSIIYISGEGKSGSTLLDIVLGSKKNCFSAGELRFFPDKGIKKKQYCACGAPVPECPVWKAVINRWDENRNLDLDSYIQIQDQLLSNRNILKARKLLNEKPQNITGFLSDTEMLYNAIFEVTDSLCIIDSSKAPGMIPILRELNFDITVIHLTRRFGDVLNSYKKSVKKDLKAGLEFDFKPISTFSAIRSWFLKNALTKRYSNGADYIRIKYEDYIYDLENAVSKITDYEPEYKKLLGNRGPFHPRHLVAGNMIRMKDELFVAQKPMNTSYERLNGTNKLLARVIDLFY